MANSSRSFSLKVIRPRNDVTGRAQRTDHPAQRRAAAIADPSLALWHHILRRRVEARTQGVLDQPFARDLDARWSAQLARKDLFTNELYLTLVRAPEPSVPKHAFIGLAKAIGRRPTPPVDDGISRISYVRSTRRPNN